MPQSHSQEMINATCCERLRKALCDDRFPLNYDDHVEEVQLLFLNEQGVAVVRYCPFCGQKLESGRSALFTKPTDDDRSDVREQLKELTSLNDVIAKLGRPNRQGSGGGLDSNPWTQWARYEDIWSSLVLTVGEHQEGGLGWVMGGRSVKQRDSTNGAI